MKDNSNGFVLVESIVAAIFVIAFSTFMIVNLLPLVGEYEKSMDYDTIESKANVHLIRKMILMDDGCRVESILKFNPSDFPNDNTHLYYFQGDEICNYLTNENYCRKLLSKDYLDVKEIIITEFSGSGLKKSSDDFINNFSRTLQDYIKYMPVYGNDTLSFYQITDRLIVSFNDNSVTNIEILKNYSSNMC